MHLLEATLKSNGYSHSLPRQRIFTLLNSSHLPVTAVEISLLLPAINKATIYRTIGLFEQLGIVTRTWQGKHLKIELGELFRPHHHHITCTACNISKTFDHQGLENALSKLALQYGYTLSDHTVELHGTCKKCRKNC